MKKVLFAILTGFSVFLWMCIPPARMHSNEMVLQPSFNSTHIDSITTLKTEIEVKIAATEVELLNVIAKTK